MAQQQVELRKIRDFSENLNDTFLFIRQNLKPLLISFMGIAGVFMLLAAIFSGLYQGQMGGTFEQIIKGTRTSENPLSIFNTNYFLLILLAWMNICAMQVVIVAYMKAYQDNGRTAPEIDEVWRLFRRYFLFLFVYSIINAMIMAVGFVMCILPGVFLAVVLMPFPAVVMMEDLSYAAAFSRCFALIKNNFWISLGLYLLVYIIYSFSSGIVSAVIGGIAGVLFYFTTKDISNTVAVITSILSILSYVFYIVFYVSVVLHYFNLAERLDGTGILQRLDSIGDSSANFNNTREEY